MINKEPRLWLVHLVLIFVAFLWGFNNIVMKIGFNYISPQSFVGIRMFLVLPCMIYFAFFSTSRIPFKRKDFWQIALIGMIGLGSFQIFFPWGIGETSAPLGGILMATMPVLVMLLSLLFRLERISWKSIIGVLLTICGLTLIMLTQGGDTIEGKTSIRGIIFIILGELGFAINTTFLKPYFKRYSLLQVTGLGMSMSVIIYMIVHFRNLSSLVGSEIPWQIWPLTAFSGFIAFLFANILWNTSIKKIGSTQVAVYGNLPTLFVLFLSALMFKQILTGWQLVGSTVILSGVVLVQFRTNRNI